jgi:cytochrome P450
MTPDSPEPGCPVADWFDPLSPRFLADPYAVLAAASDAGGAPVFFAPSIGYYVVTRHADIEQVFADPATYSAAVAQAPLVPLAAGTSRSRRWSAWTSPRTRGCASRPPARSR